MKNPFSRKLLATAPASELYEKLQKFIAERSSGTQVKLLRGKMVVAALLLAVTLFAGPAKAQASPTLFYVVTAVDANGFESVFSTQATAVFTQGKHVSAISWTAPTVPTGGAAIAGYNIYRGTVSGGPYAKINTALVTAVTFSDSFTLPLAPSGLTITVN